MNFLGRMQEEEPSIPMTPMIDIVFLLLIFFITTSVFARLENELSVTVPTAESATPPQRDLGELIVNVKHDGAIIVNQRTVTMAQLEILLSRIAKQYPDQSVIIRGDRESRLEYAVQILDTCAKAGVWNIQIAALPPEDTMSR
ncbi:MAG: biopolymer transporter ExbD [Candidatus Omnitrophota bacterium]|jgi:biopolymer transport protein ExbD|nr:MAG: biopolymer transporter ExbD [Candidatus Omnitrophota bacterium]